MSPNKYGVTDTEYKIICTQQERRKQFRKEYLKQRTNPYLHAKEPGHVFDENHQRFIAMEATKLERFIPNRKNSIFGICAIIIPMVSYGLLVTSNRTKREEMIRSGEIIYKNRLFKLC